MKRDTNADARRTFHVTIPQKVEDITVFLVQDRGISPLEALEVIYRSDMYRMLEIERTKYWHYGSVQLYELLQEELNA